MRLLIINQPLNNRGDESAHKALVRRLVKSFPDSKITVLFVGSNDDSIRQFSVINENVKYINLKPFKAYGRMTRPVLVNKNYWLWYLHPTTRELLKIYKHADWVVCAPGGICMGGFQNWSHLFFLKLAQFLGKPIAYYGRSFGPFPVSSKNNKIFKEISINLLNYFSFLSIRDAETEKLAKLLGLNFISTVDTAFLDTPKGSLPAEIKDLIGETNYIVFVPNLLVWHYAFKDKVSKGDVTEFYKGIFQIISVNYPSHKIVMLPQTFNHGNATDDDINYFIELKNEIKSERILIIGDNYSSDIQQSIISKADLMVGARYHSIVFAINNDTPFIALSYEHKIAGLLETLGMQHKMIKITPELFNSNQSLNEAFADFSELIQNTEDISIFRNKAKINADNCYEKFLKVVDNQNSSNQY